MPYTFVFLVLLAGPLIVLSVLASPRWAFGFLLALGVALLGIWVWRRYGGPFPRETGPYGSVMRDLYWSFVRSHLLAAGIYTGFWLWLVRRKRV
jgi:hypothetical protein